MSLPTPLLFDRDYYVIHESDTQIKLADTLQDALDGIPINLEDNGDGDVMVIRQNTAEFKLKLEPVSQDLYINQLPMGIDFQNKVQPAALFPNTEFGDYGEGGVSWNSDHSFLVLGFLHFDLGEGGNTVISVQRSRVNRYLNMCQWNFWTIETSIALCEFGSEATEFRGMVRVPNGKIWIATNEGVYEYDTASRATPPSLITISDLISTDIKDIVSLENSTFLGDEQDTYVWTGHSTGITRIDPTNGNSCKKYITGAGEELEGLTAGYENIETGSMSVSVSSEGKIRVLVCGHMAGGSTGNPWVIEDGSGFLIIPVTGNIPISGALRKYTKHIVIAAGYTTTRVFMFQVTVIGKNFGHIDTVENFSLGANSYYREANTQMVQLSDDTFVFSAKGEYPYYYTYTFYYKIGVAPNAVRNNYTQLPSPHTVGWVYAFPRYHFYAFMDSLGDTINIPMHYDMCVLSPSVGSYLDTLGYSLGDDAWRIDRSGYGVFGSRKLRSSNIIANALTANANNAVGKDWDTQFVAGDHFTFMHGFTKFKDNLQTMLLRFRSYGVNAREETRSITIPNSDPSYYQVPESVVENFPNFREIDNYDLCTIVEWNETRFIQHTLPAMATFTVNIDTDVLTVGVDIADDTPIMVDTDDWKAKRLPYPLRYRGVYFAKRVDATKIQLSLTPGGAAIDLTDIGVSTYRFAKVEPTVGKYYLGMNGVFIFSQDDIEKNVDLRYVVTDYN